ncbi:MAG TPA: SIMPL domain-containing protein [Candidatus Didemnitutus sp.]|nr:SIMPL domain-containing protein [Candidatus Didemnitutus sp.]
MNPSRPHLFGVLAGVFLAAGLAFASMTLANAWTRIAESQVINVTGSAHKNVHSDLVLWRASVAVEAPTLLDAQENLRSDAARLGEFLHAHGFNDYNFAPPQIQELLAKRHHKEDDTTENVRVGYQLTQAVTVHSSEVERLAQLVGNSGELIQQGVNISSDGLTYIYTRAGDAKVEMMADATRDARSRAEQIAAQGGRRVKELRSARMGVVQINPIYSGATSAEGNNDTSTSEKTITATVSATFALQ